jgi:hypothetical protein
LILWLLAMWLTEEFGKQENLIATFHQQAGACRALGAAFMADQMDLLPKIWPEDTRLARLYRNWPGDLGPSHASLPLRLAPGLHASVISGQDQPLGSFYPPHPPDPAQFASALYRALKVHDAYLCGWTAQAPQNNETALA